MNQPDSRILGQTGQLFLRNVAEQHRTGLLMPRLETQREGSGASSSTRTGTGSHSGAGLRLRASSARSAVPTSTATTLGPTAIYDRTPRAVVVGICVRFVERCSWST